MKKLIPLILFPFLVIPFVSKANDNFSVEIEALTLVMEQYKENTESSVELDKENKKTLNICGHYHPKIYIKNNGDKLSFRCFAMDINKNVLYIPAFGDLTGGYPCKKSFKKWAIVSEEEIIEIKT